MGIYVDLLGEVIAEPERTHVFADEQTGLAYKVMTSRKSNDMLKTHSLDIAPGIIVAWNGVPWTIANIGENSISLRTEIN